MTKNRKHSFLVATLTMIIGFCGGFLFSQVSEEHLAHVGLAPKPLRILVQNEQILPKSLQEVLRTKSHLHLEFQYYENRESLEKMAPYFDIFFGETSEIENHHIPSRNFSSLSGFIANISPDFLTIYERKNSLLPLSWQWSPDIGLKIYSLSAKPTKIKETDSLLQVWLARDFVEMWAETTDLATTYMTLDESTLDTELKSSWLRALPLTTLSTSPLLKGSPLELPRKQK